MPAIVRRGLLTTGLSSPTWPSLATSKAQTSSIFNINSVFGSDFPLASIILPLGISFYTFQKIGFLVDVYERKISEIRPLRVHPHGQLLSAVDRRTNRPLSGHRAPVVEIAAGGRPIDRSRAVDVAGWPAKALFADALAIYAAPRFVEVAQPVQWIFTLAGSGPYLDTFQIYFDFSGYCDMAVGLALMFGIVLPINFNSPYKSASIIDFWRTWHHSVPPRICTFRW